MRHLSGMLKAARSSLSGLAVVVAVAFALLATGFAHRAPTVDDALLEAYALSYGSVETLCGDIDGDGVADRSACSACRIVGVTNLPVADLSLRDADLIVIATVVAPRANRAARMVRDPALGLRAPPAA
ncbi:hypothetical protein [Pontitalea aquivivens]|uniref:hypothetical protein n=1 Tax=Pontitalea aquivivens TaxID=3388663 RepID=UPI003970D0AA